MAILSGASMTTWGSSASAQPQRQNQILNVSEDVFWILCVSRAPMDSSCFQSPALEPLWLSSSNGRLASSIPTATLRIRSPEFPVFGLLLYLNKEYSGLLRVDFTTILSLPLFRPYSAFSQLPTLLRLYLVPCRPSSPHRLPVLHF